MRLLVIPFIITAMLFQASGPVFGNNQEAAEKIANAIGQGFPDADIAVQYQGGKVWLKGESASPSQRQQIVEHVKKIPCVNVTEVHDAIISASAPQASAPQPSVNQARPAQRRAAVSALTDPAPLPNTVSRTATPGVQQRQAQPAPAPRTTSAVPLAPYAQQHYPAAYGVQPGQPHAVGAPFAPVHHTAPAHMMPAHAAPGHIVVGQPIGQRVPQQAPLAQQHTQPHQPMYYGPPPGAAHHPEAYGPQGPLPGQYNHPNLPEYAWPAYANYPNYAQVTYPRAYSPKAWPYIGPFYPYPQVPMEWRKVTLEYNNGNWWLDFDDGTPSGPFSGLFRQTQQYRY